MTITHVLVHPGIMFRPKKVRWCCKFHCRVICGRVTMNKWQFLMTCTEAIDLEKPFNEELADWNKPGWRFPILCHFCLAWHDYTILYPDRKVVVWFDGSILEVALGTPQRWQVSCRRCNGGRSMCSWLFGSIMTTKSSTVMKNAEKGLSENRVYSQWNSHLMGIMIINHWV